MRSSWVFFKLVLYLCNYSLFVDGNAMLKPTHRGVMWTRAAFNSGGYNYMGINCGGINRLRKNDGKCGLCGDAYNGPRRHETGGKYATGAIADVLDRGERYMNVKILLNSDQGGYFEFRLCESNGTAETQACFDKHLLKVTEGRLQGDELAYIVERAGMIHLTLEIPEKVYCTKCVLQWKYVTGNTFGRDEHGIGCLGCGHQETYINCADITIKGWEMPPTLAPVTAPSTLAWTTSTVAPTTTTTPPPTTRAPATTDNRMNQLTRTKPNTQRTYVTKYRQPSTDYDEGSRHRGRNGNEKYYVYTPVALPPQVPVVLSSNQKRSPAANSIPLSAKKPKAIATEAPAIPKVQSVQADNGVSAPKTAEPKKVTNRNIKRNVPFKIPRPPMLSSEQIDALNNNKNVVPHHDPLQKYIEVGSSRIVAAVDFTTMRAQQVQTPPTLPRNEMSKPKSTISTLDLTQGNKLSGMNRASKQKSLDVFSSFGDEMLGVPTVQNKRYGSNLMNEYSLISNAGLTNNSLQQRGQERNQKSISRDLFSEFAFENANALNRYPTANINSKNTNGDPSKIDRYPAANMNSKKTVGHPSKIDRYPAANIKSQNTYGDISKIDRYPSANMNSQNINGDPRKVDRYPTANINSQNINGDPKKVDRYPTANMNSQNINGDLRKVDRYPTANMNSKNINGDPSNRYDYLQNHEHIARGGSQKSSFGEQSRRYNYPEQHNQQSASSASYGSSVGDSSDIYNNPQKQQPGSSGYQRPSVGAPSNRNNYPQQPNPSRGGVHDSSTFSRQQDAGSLFNGQSNYPGQQTFNFNSEPNVFGGNVNSIDSNEFSQNSAFPGQISNSQFDQIPMNAKTRFGNVPNSDSSFNAYPGQNQSPYGTLDKNTQGKSRKTTSLPVIDTSTHRSRNSDRNNIPSRLNMPLEPSPNLNAPAVPINLFKERKQESFQAPIVFERFTNYQVGDSETKQKAVPGNVLQVSNSIHQSTNRATNNFTAHQDLHLNADIHSPQNYFGQDHYIAHNAENSYPAFGGPGTQDLQSQQELYVGPPSESFRNDPLNFVQQVNFNAQIESPSYVNDPRKFGKDVAPTTQSETQSYVNDPRKFGQNVVPTTQSESQSYVNDPWILGQNVALNPKGASQSFGNDPRNSGQLVDQNAQNNPQSYVNFPFNFAQNDAANAQSPSKTERNDPRIFGQQVASEGYTPPQPFRNNPVGYGQHVASNDQTASQSLRNDPLNFGHNSDPYVQRALQSNKNGPFDFRQNGGPNVQSAPKSVSNDPRTFGRQVADVYSPPQPFGNNPDIYGRNVAASNAQNSSPNRNDLFNFGQNVAASNAQNSSPNRNDLFNLGQNVAASNAQNSSPNRNDLFNLGQNVAASNAQNSSPNRNDLFNLGQNVAASNAQNSSPNRNDLFNFGQNFVPPAQQSNVNDPLNFGNDLLFNKPSESVRNDNFNFGQQMTSNSDSQSQSYVNFPLNFAGQDFPNDQSASRPVGNDILSNGQHAASDGQSFKNHHLNYGLHAPENYFPQGNQDANHAQFPLKIVSTKINHNMENAMRPQLSGSETLSPATASAKQAVKVTPLSSTTKPVTSKTTTDLTTDAIDYQMKELDNLRKKLERLQMLINQKTTGIQPKSPTTSLKQNKKRSSTVIGAKDSLTNELGNMLQSKMNSAANTPLPNDNNTPTTNFQSSKADVTDSKTNIISPLTPSTVPPSMSRETTQYINTFKAQMLQSIKDANAKKHRSQSTHTALKTKPDVFSTKPYNTESTAHVTPLLPLSDQKPKVSSTLLPKEPTVPTQQNVENLSQPESNKETKLQQQKELEKKNKYRQLLELILERRRQRKLNANQQKETSDANQNKHNSKPKQFDNLQPVQQQNLQHKSNVLPKQLRLSEIKAQSTKRERISQTTSLRPVLTTPAKAQDSNSRSGNYDQTVEKTSLDKLADKIAARMAEKLKSGGANGLPGFKVVPLSSGSVMDTLRNIALNALKDKNVRTDETGKITDNKVIQTAKETNSQAEKTVAREMHMPENVQKQNTIKNTMTTLFKKNNQLPSSSRQIITTTNQSPTQTSQDKVTRRQELIKKMKEMLLKRRSAQINNTTFGNNNRPVHLPSTRPSHLELAEARGNQNRPVNLPSSRPSHLNQGEVRGNNNRPVHITDHPNNGRPTIYDKQTTSQRNIMPATNTRFVKTTEQIKQKRTTHSVQEVHNNQSEANKNKENVSPDIARSMLARVREMLAKKKNSERNSKPASPQTEEVKPLRKDVLFRLLQSMKKQKNSIGS